MSRRESAAVIHRPDQRVREWASDSGWTGLCSKMYVSTGEELNEITEKIIGCGIRVHKELGPGLLESAYRQCLASELDAAGLRVETEVPIPLRYRDREVACSYRLDLLVEGSVKWRSSLSKRSRRFTLRK